MDSITSKYVLLHDIDLENITLHYVAFASHYLAWNCMTLHDTFIHAYHTSVHVLHHITLHYISLHCIALHCITISSPLHYITMHCMHGIILQYIAFYRIKLHYTTLRCVTLHYITLHYIVLHACVRACVRACVCVRVLAGIVRAWRCTLSGAPRLPHVQMGRDQLASWRGTGNTSVLCARVCVCFVLPVACFSSSSESLAGRMFHIAFTCCLDKSLMFSATIWHDVWSLAVVLSVCLWHEAVLDRAAHPSCCFLVACV